MSILIDFLKSDIFLIIIGIISIILLILYVVSTIKLSKLKKEYTNFMKKLGNGDNLEEILKVYISRVEKVEKENEEIVEYYKKMNEIVGNCVQKVGIVRYNAFADTGSDLSFALALLTRENNGVVLNGIYSREMSNIYAKPIVNGKSTYTLSEEEKEAISNAIG